MDIVIPGRLPFCCRLRFIWFAWTMGDFRGSLRVLVFGRTARSQVKG